MMTLKILGALTLVAVHVMGVRLHGLHVIPRSAWLSAAGGASVAYIFLHLLPELAHAQDWMGSRLSLDGRFASRLIYLLGLGGLSLFYGLERYVRLRKRERDRESPLGGFWLHMASFSLYNGLIGYLLADERDKSAIELALFILAMALHFLVNDHGLRAHHKQLYDRWGRWILSFATLTGVGLGLFVAVDRLYLFSMLAFLAGAVLLNVLKEELPEERESRFLAFMLGAAGYSLLLLAI